MPDGQTTLKLTDGQQAVILVEGDIVQARHIGAPARCLRISSAGDTAEEAFPCRAVWELAGVEQFGIELCGLREAKSSP